ncbi:MAG: hypothetical protein K0S76_2401 [Herbinix sp.]|jgi:peptide maturation system acyl carrier-related protein|nr:hypothetical protein [Herbinix sp.]
MYHIDLHDNITGKLKEIILKRFGLDFNIVEPIHYDVSLLDGVFSFAARDLLYLFFDIEHEFDICIPEEDIEEDRFSSFHSIVEVIERQLACEDGNRAVNQ